MVPPDYLASIKIVGQSVLTLLRPPWAPARLVAYRVGGGGPDWGPLAHWYDVLKTATNLRGRLRSRAANECWSLPLIVADDEHDVSNPNNSGNSDSYRDQGPKYVSIRNTR